MLRRALVAGISPRITGRLRAILESEGWKLCAESANGRNVFKRAVKHLPDAVILNGSSADFPGLEGIQQIREQCPRAEILVVLGNHIEERFARGAGGVMNPHNFIPEADLEKTMVLALRDIATRNEEPGVATVGSVASFLEKKEASR